MTEATGVPQLDIVLGGGITQRLARDYSWLTRQRQDHPGKPDRVFCRQAWAEGPAFNGTFRANNEVA